MCAQVGTYLLGAFGLFVVITAAAFAYLPWWQALPTSLVSGYVIARVLRWLALRAVRRVGSLLEAALQLGRGVLRHAQVDVHSVRPLGAPMLGAFGDSTNAESAGPAPAAVVPGYQIELTVFPPGASAQAPWDARTLRLGHADAANPAEYEPTRVELVENGESAELEGPFTGARRLRLAATLPPEWRACTLRSGGNVLCPIPLR